MLKPFQYLEGRRICVVFVKVVDPETERVQLQCFRGRASVERNQINVVAPNGVVFSLPSSSWNTIMPNDGTAMLQDADYFVLVKTDENINLVSPN